MRTTIILILLTAVLSGCAGGGTKTDGAATASETAESKKVCRREKPNATSRVGRMVCR